MTTPAGQTSSPRLPLFCLVMAIIDLVFSLFRVPLLGLGIIGVFALARTDHPLLVSGFFEILTGCGIVLFGISSNILILFKKRIAVIFAVLNIFFTLASFFVGIWQSYINLQQSHDVETSLVAATLVGILGGLAVRFIILLLYSFAVVRYSIWSGENIDPST